MAIKIVHTDTETGIKVVEDVVEEPEAVEGEEPKEHEKFYQFEVSEAPKEIAEQLSKTKYMPMPRIIRTLKDLRRKGTALSIDTEMMISAEDRRLLTETLDSYNEDS